MLTAILLQLTPAAGGSVPAYLGRAHYAAVLDRLATVDPALAESIHHGDGPKPLTCSGLLDARGLPLAPSRAGKEQAERAAVHTGQTLTVRVTGLTPAVSAALEACLLNDRPAIWPLDDQPFQVTDALCDPARHPWSGRTTYEQLAAAQLTAAAPPPRQATLEFVSPTTFKSGGMHMPVPLPELVFGSLVERWNAFSPVTLSPEMRRFGAEALAISRYRLESKAVGQKGQSIRIGGVGRVTYHALHGDRYWLSLLQMLAEYAFYSGVGAQTTMGMGQARKG